MRKPNLFQKFLLILALSIILAVLTLAGAISYLSKRNFLDEEAKETAGLVRMVASEGLSTEEFLQAMQEPDGILFRRLAERLVLLPDLIRVKIYNATGVLVWSDEKRLIGRKFSDNRDLEEALKGEVRVAIGLLKREHVYEREKYDEKRLLEIYVPLHDPVSGEVYGVLEIYKHPVSHFALLDRMRWTVWVISVLVGGFLFASCSWFFWDAMKRQERLDTEKSLIQAQLIHAEKLASVGEMLAGLAHEINNPLGVIMSKVRLVLKELRASNSKAELLEDLRVIDRNISRIAGIVRSLLAFSRKSHTELARLDLNAIIGECLTLVEKPFAQVQIEFEWDPAPSLPCILGDANQIQQVFLNLLGNARDAMQAGGIITIRTYASNHDDCRVVAQVHDSGHGIPAEILGKIFDPFFTTKGRREGAGLGLAVSHSIVKAHRGTIRAESQLGEGATFTLSFPAVTT